MDSQITGHVSNIEHLIGLEQFSYIHYDITNYVHIPGNVDYILHFASPASPNDYLRYPIQTLKVGALGTHNLLGLAKAKGARILIASTSEVYGNPQIHPQHEGYWGHVNPVGPRGVYDEAKRYQEAMTMAYHQSHGLETRIARIFNTYGPRMRYDDGRVIPNFIANLMNNNPIEIYGDGLQTRSFCYIDDTVEAIYRLLMVDDYALPVNIGNDEEINLIDLAHKIKDLLNCDIEITFKDIRSDDPVKRRPDVTLANKLLNWRPNVKLEEGLSQTIEYFKNGKLN